MRRGNTGLGLGLMIGDPENQLLKGHAGLSKIGLRLESTPQKDSRLEQIRSQAQARRADAMPALFGQADVMHKINFRKSHTLPVIHV